MSRYIWGDLSFFVEDRGVFLGLDRVCIYYIDVNWEFLRVGEESFFLLGGGIDVSCVRWNDCGLCCKVIRDCVYRVGNWEVWKNKF